MLAKSGDAGEERRSRIRATARFRQAHNGIGDTRINNVGNEILKERGQIEVILRNWRIAFFAIAGVWLLIGGVGIFSVLKISISERLLEIGLRKSMGATDESIFLQFLIESISSSSSAPPSASASAWALSRSSAASSPPASRSPPSA